MQLTLGAGAGILDPMKIVDSTFTGDAGATCGNSGSGINMVNVENSYVSLDTVTIRDNGFGVFFEKSSGEIINSTIDINCAGVNTNGFKQTGSIKHTLTINDNTITTADGAGITAFDQARISASRNIISGAEGGSGIAIRSSTANLYDNEIGPIGGYNGIWISELLKSLQLAITLRIPQEKQLSMENTITAMVEVGLQSNRQNQGCTWREIS